MAIFRGVGGSGDSSDNSFLDAVTAQANSASASATSAANSLAAIQQTEVTSASFNTGDGVLTLTKTGGATVTADLDGRFLTSYTETNNLTTAVTWANVPDANITESSVTQYLTAANVTSPLTGGTGISVASNGTITNDSPDQTVALTGTGATTITGTYPNFTINSVNTTYTVGDGGLTTNDFTDADHSKLNGIEANATADQTGAEIKSAYEAVSDTNAFTDAEKSKLSGIEASADVTDTTNVTSAGAAMLTGADFTGDVSVDGDITVTGTVDGRDVSVDGTKLDTLERVYRCRFSKGSPLLTLYALSTNPIPLGDTYNTKATTGSENTLNLSVEMSHSDLYDTNDAYYNVNVYAGSNESVITLGTLTSVITIGAYRRGYVSGDVTKHFSDFMGIARNSDGSSPINLNGFGWYYNVSENRTYIYSYLYQSNNFNANETLYLHPFDWESSGTVIQSSAYDLDRAVYDGAVKSTHTKEHYLGYFKSSIDVGLSGAEPSNNTDGNNVSINKISGSIVQIED